MERKPYLAGNWKMNLERSSALALARSIAQHLEGRDDVDCAVFPPAVYVSEVVRALEDSAVAVGVQNVHDRSGGAHTGEISVAMARDVGATICLVGHSERRHEFGEDEAFIAAKVQAVLAGGMELVLCIGEKLEEREGGRTEEVVGRQISSALVGVPRDALARITLAYEPVWAIGTGKTASPEQAEQVHSYLRGLVQGLYDREVAQALRIQYGGSVKASNAADLLAQEDIDGALIGGASLDFDSFAGILDAAAR